MYSHSRACGVLRLSQLAGETVLNINAVKYQLTPLNGENNIEFCDGLAGARYQADP